MNIFGHFNFRTKSLSEIKPVRKFLVLHVKVVVIYFGHKQLVKLHKSNHCLMTEKERHHGSEVTNRTC